MHVTCDHALREGTTNPQEIGKDVIKKKNASHFSSNALLVCRCCNWIIQTTNA